MTSYSKEVSAKQKKAFSKFLSEEEELKVATGYGTFYLRQRFIIQLALPWGIFWVGGLGLAFVEKFNLSYGILLGLLAACIASLIQTWVINQSHRYLLTTRRVVIKNGFFSVQIASALYDKITHIEVDEGLFDRIFLHHGTVIVNTAGANKDALVLKYVEHPIEFKNILERLIHKRNTNFEEKKEESKPLRMLK